MNPIFCISKTALKDPLIFGDIKLYQVGRLYFKEGENDEISRAHVHDDWFELTIATGGQAYLLSNGEKNLLKSGQIYLGCPYETHEILAVPGDSFRYDLIAFHTEDPQLREKLEQIPLLLEKSEFRIFNDERIDQLVNNCILELKVEDAHRDEIICANLTLIMHYLIRDFSDMKGSSKTKPTRNEILCFQVMHYIDSHLLSLTSLHEVAEKFNYNYTYLSALFRKTANISLSDYYNEKKLSFAKQLILENKLKVSEVAEKLNYANPYAFSKAFKKHFRISPKHMQQETAEKIH